MSLRMAALEMLHNQPFDRRRNGNNQQIEPASPLGKLRAMYEMGQLPRTMQVWPVVGGRKWLSLGAVMDETFPYLKGAPLKGFKTHQV